MGWQAELIRDVFATARENAWTGVPALPKRPDQKCRIALSDRGSRRGHCALLVGGPPADRASERADPSELKTQPMLGNEKFSKNRQSGDDEGDQVEQQLYFIGSAVGHE